MIAKRAAQHRGRRRGMTVLLVLGVLALTIALSYAMLRTQVTSSQVQENLNHRDDARQAAMTGLMVALRQMHSANWSGVGTQFVGTVDSGVYYKVVYQAGDSNLSVGDSDYAMYPYRVTVQSTGYAVNTADSLVTATHEAQAVVELVPRALSTQPAGWSALQNYTVHQWENEDVVIQSPVRVDGPVSLQGPVKLCEDYPPSSRPWDGKIDEVALFNTALSDDDVEDLAGAALFGKTYLTAQIEGLSPAHYWMLDESSGATVATDSAGSADGTYENGTAAGASGYGTSNNCAEFDGRNDHINVGNFDMTGDKLSVVALFKADSWDASTYARIVSKATGVSNDEHYWMLSTAPSGSNIRLRFRLRSNGWTKALVAGSGNLVPGYWYLAVAVYDGDDMILYLNGSEVGRASKSGDIDTNPDVPVYLGESPPGSPQTRLLRDLEAMRVAGLDDWRPLEGPVDLPRSNTDDSTLAMLDEDLNLTTNDVAQNNTAPVSHPGAISTYQLYQGGPTYTPETINGGSLNKSLSADPKTNPLGLFNASGKLKIQKDLNVEATIVVSGSNADLEIKGDNTILAPVSLPALYGTSTPIELPVAIVADDVKVENVTGVTLSGLVFAADETEFETGSQDASCHFSGKLLTGKLSCQGRDEWDDISSSQWESTLTTFVNQLSGDNPETYFPNWLSDQLGLSSEPLLKIEPRDEAVSYHWQDWTKPVFVPHADDEGLLWRIIRMDDIE